MQQYIAPIVPDTVRSVASPGQMPLASQDRAVAATLAKNTGGRGVRHRREQKRDTHKQTHTCRHKRTMIVCAHHQHRARHTLHNLCSHTIHHAPSETDAHIQTQGHTAVELLKLAGATPDWGEQPRPDPHYTLSNAHICAAGHGKATWGATREKKRERVADSLAQKKCACRRTGHANAPESHSSRRFTS